MLVNYPFSVRKDNLATKAFEQGTIEATASEIRLFISVEEGEVSHMPTYGVKKRDLLFSTIDDSTLGVLIHRIQEKINTWFSQDIRVLDAVVREQRNHYCRITVTLQLGDDEFEVGVDIE